jgi:hypothetical protein
MTTAQDAATLNRDLNDLALNAAILARDPANAFDTLVGLTGSLRVSLPPALGVQALLEAYGFAPGDRPPATTATREAEQDLYDLLIWLVRVHVLVEASRLAAVADYDSYDAAVAARDAIADRLDEQLDYSDDGTYATIAQLRADLVRAVPGESRDLPRMVRYTPPYTVPSLVLAHRLYGGISLESDIVTRNGVARPGFVPGGVQMEVLSRGA